MVSSDKSLQSIDGEVSRDLTGLSVPRYTWWPRSARATAYALIVVGMFISNSSLL